MTQKQHEGKKLHRQRYWR